jgi:vancomycin resistance protein VanJ
MAIVQLFAPHLALACIALVPVAALSRSRRLVATLAAVALLFALRFGAEWWSSAVPARDASTNLDVLTWNLEAGSRPGADSAAMLVGQHSDLIALEELTFDAAAAIDSDPVLAARYPYRVLEPSGGVTGAGLLSRFPITASEFRLDPVRLETRVALPEGAQVVLVAHPFPGRIRTIGGIPVGFDPAQRNADLGLIRARVKELDALDVPVLLIGDFNTAPTDPAFRGLTGGLHDAHAEAGIGPGWTWRPGGLAWIGTGLLRIDLVLSTSQLRPTATSVVCPIHGDHCLVAATLARS